MLFCQLGYYADAQTEYERLSKDMHRLSTENSQLKREVDQLEADLDKVLAEKERIESGVSIYVLTCSSILCFVCLTQMLVQNKGAEQRCQGNIQLLKDGLLSADKPLPDLVEFLHK